MKKHLSLLTLILFSLTACGNTEEIPGDNFYQVGREGVTLYLDGTSDCYQFKNDFLTFIYHSIPSGKSDGKREKFSVSHTYINISSNLIFLNYNNSSWYDIYQFKTKSECTESSDLQHFQKPDKPKSGYQLYGEFGDGWIKVYNSRNETGFDLFVTESYAKKVGIKLVSYEYYDTWKTYRTVN